MTTFNEIFISAVKRRAAEARELGQKSLAASLESTSRFLTGVGDLDKFITEMTAEDINLTPGQDLAAIKDLLFDLVKEAPSLAAGPQ